jgi:hypothetical protein
MVSVPVPFIAETALSIRFVQTWLSSLAYAGISGSARSSRSDAVDRVQRRRLRDPVGGVLLQLDQRLQGHPVIRPGRDHAQLVPHSGDPLAQRGGRADGGGGRIVELMRQAGRQ